MKNCLGIEIGHYRIKIAYMERGVLKRYFSERIETDTEFASDMAFYARFLQEVLGRSGIRCKKVVFALPQDDTYVKRFQLPLMTVEQLKMNLPYEFHDYTGDQLDAYQYDYGVLGRTEEGLDLLAAACSKELCQAYQKLAKMAKLKIVGLVPAVVGLERILERAQKEEKHDFAVLDLGTKAIRIHFFRKGIYDITRTMESGCEEIERIQSGDQDMIDTLGLDVQEAFWDGEGTTGVDQILSERYRTIAVQVMRVLNFYSFNNADNTIDSLYYCGGGARYEALIEEIGETLDIPVKSFGELLPEVNEDEMPEWIDSPQTFGVLLT